MVSRFPTLIAAFSLAANTALAQDPAQDAVSHRVLPGWTQADGSIMAALELNLAPGWKTYWRVPGDAGIPPRFDWTSARNVKSVKLHWPTPKVFWQSGMRSIGYDTRVVLPMSITPKRSGRSVRLKGQMDLGICSDICVPARLRIDANLEPDTTDRNAAIIGALAAVPYSGQEAGVKSARCTFRQSSDGISLVARVQYPASGAREEAVVEQPNPDIWVSDAKAARAGDTLTVTAEMVSVSGAPLVINRSDIRITVLGGSFSVDIKGCTG